MLIQPSNLDECWELWKQYRKEQHGFTYKPIGEGMAKKSLMKLAKGNETTAIEIMEQSMANGWNGFFELKNKTNGNEPTIEAIHAATTAKY
jgi:hypothetical protein